MSFPVPTKYLSNDNGDATTVVYSNGNKIELPPVIPGIRPENVLLYYELTANEDITAENAFTLPLKEANNFLILFIMLSHIETPDSTHNYIPWLVGETQGTNIFRFGRYLQTNGSMGGQTTGTVFFNYDSANNNVSFPADPRYHILAGQKIGVYQIKLAAVN